MHNAKTENSSEAGAPGERKFLGIQIIGWGVIYSNILLLIVEGVIPRPSRLGFSEIIFTVLSPLAAFPQEFYHVYLREFWVCHFLWILLMIFSAFGLLRFKKSARIIFVTLNIVHIVILTYLTLIRYGQDTFLNYFFKLYFNLVASGTYIGLVTVPEAREQFHSSAGVLDFIPWKLKSRKLFPKTGNSDGYYKLGLAYYRMKRYDEAIEMINKAIAATAKIPAYHQALGNIYMEKGDFARAVKELKKTVHLDPIQPRAYFDLGLVFQKEGCNHEALEAFLKALHARPSDKEIYPYLAAAYLACNHPDEALQYYSEFLKARPKDAGINYRVGLIHLNNKEDLNEARKFFQKSVRFDPKFNEARFQLAMVCLKTKNYRDAIRTFKEVIRQEEDHLEAHYQLGFTYAMIGDFESARRECRFIGNQDPDLAENLKLVIG